MITADNNVLLDALTAAVNEAVEAMFFDAAEPVCECDCTAGCDALTAALYFRDTRAGEFMLTAPLPTATALAAGFMGIEAQDVDRSHAEQTICELANIICGSALSRLEPSAELTLSSPQPTSRVCTNEDGVVYQHYRLLDGCLAVSVRIP